MKVKILCRKVRLNQGGYDSNGYYYGVGQSVYQITDEWGTELFVCRASSRVSALSKFANAKPWEKN